MKNLNLFDNILIEENRKIRKWPLNETEKDNKKNKEGFMNLFEQIYNDNQDVEEVAFKCVSNALGPDLMKALTIITHDVRDHIVVIIRKVPEDTDFNELFSTIHSNAMDSGLFDDVAWETDDEETTMFLNFIKAEKTWDGRDFTGTDVVPGEDYFDECCKTKRNRMTEANGHEITSEGFASFLKENGFKFFKSGTIENQSYIDVYEGSGNFKELLNEYTDDGTRSFSCTTVDNGTYWYVSSVYTSDESLSDALHDNDDDVIADKIDYQVVCYGNSHGYSLDDLYNLSHTENKMDSDADEDFNKFCQDHADDVHDCFRESREVNASKNIKESETTDYEEAGWELVNNAIDSFEYSDRQVDRIHIKAKDTGDTVIVHVTGMPKVAKKRLSDFIDDNLTKAGFEGTSRVGVFGDEIIVELWKDFDECGEMEESGMMDNGNAGNAGTADGFAAFLTRKGFDLYESGTMENQGDIDTYEGDGNFMSLFNEYISTETDGTRNFVCATADSRYWYVSSSYDSDEELMDDLAEDDPSSLDVDFCVVCYGA